MAEEVARLEPKQEDWRDAERLRAVEELGVERVHHRGLVLGAASALGGVTPVCKGTGARGQAASGRADWNGVLFVRRTRSRNGIGLLEREHSGGGMRREAALHR